MYPFLLLQCPSQLFNRQFYKLIYLMHLFCLNVGSGISIKFHYYFENPHVLLMHTVKTLCFEKEHCVYKSVSLLLFYLKLPQNIPRKLLHKFTKNETEKKRNLDVKRKSHISILWNHYCINYNYFFTFLFCNYEKTHLIYM